MFSLNQIKRGSHAALFSSIALLSTNVLSATDLGVRSYSAYANGPNLPSQTIHLPAYEGANTVFYHDASQVSLNRQNINTVVDYFDVAMELYRQYGRLSQYPNPNGGGITNPSNKGSVVLREGPNGGTAAGLGLNGKAEVFKFWFNRDAFNQVPLDIRTWEIAYYELGRGTHFAIYDFFHFANGSQDISSAFPRFITYATMEDLGINHSSSNNDARWGGNVGVNPFAMNAKLQPLLNANPFLNFYQTDSKGSTGFIESDLNRNGTIDGNERIGLNDGQATVFYFLRKEFGKSFMAEFFNYAADHAVLHKPSNGEEALCNIVQAGNEALLSTQNVALSSNRVGQYLENTFNFPSCTGTRPTIRHASFDGDWFYLEWEPVVDANRYIQFVIGDNSNGRKFLFVENEGATDRGDYVYQYYHRNGICEAFGAGSFKLTAQVWPNDDSSRAEDAHTIHNQQTITCP